MTLRGTFLDPSRGSFAVQAGGSWERQEQGGIFGVPAVGQKIHGFPVCLSIASRVQNPHLQPMIYNLVNEYITDRKFTRDVQCWGPRNPVRGS